MADAPAAAAPVVIGKIVGLFGVRGWVKVHAYTRERTDVMNYPVWLIAVGDGWTEHEVSDIKPHGPGLIAQLAGFDDRDAAQRLVGADIAIRRTELPALADGEFYWADLEGLAVVNRAGVELGHVSHLFETGANDVMVVRGERERLIPYIDGVVESVDLAQGRILVDWDADF